MTTVLCILFDLHMPCTLSHSSLHNQHGFKVALHLEINMLDWKYIKSKTWFYSIKSKNPYVSMIYNCCSLRFDICGEQYWLSPQQDLESCRRQTSGNVDEGVSNFKFVELAWEEALWGLVAALFEVESRLNKKEMEMSIHFYFLNIGRMSQLPQTPAAMTS